MDVNHAAKVTIERNSISTGKELKVHFVAAPFAAGEGVPSKEDYVLVETLVSMKNAVQTALRRRLAAAEERGRRFVDLIVHSIEASSTACPGDRTQLPLDDFRSQHA